MATPNQKLISDRVLNTGHESKSCILSVFRSATFLKWLWKSSWILHLTSKFSAIAFFNLFSFFFSSHGHNRRRSRHSRSGWQFSRPQMLNKWGFTKAQVCEMVSFSIPKTFQCDNVLECHTGYPLARQKSSSSLSMILCIKVGQKD